MNTENFSHLRKTLSLKSGTYTYYSLKDLEREGLGRLDSLPFSIRVLLESVVRKCNGQEITRADVANLANWEPQSSTRPAMSFFPGGSCCRI